MDRHAKLLVCLLAASLTGATAARADSYGGAGAHFFVTREVPGSAPAGEGCLAHYHLLPEMVDAVRESQLVAQVPDPDTAAYPLAPTGSVVGSVSVCFIASFGRDHQALGLLELVRGEERLTVEAAGNCREYPTPKDTRTFFQSCSLQVTGPHAERVRSGSLTSGGLVPKAEPAATIAPGVWTLFLVRD